MEDEVTIDGVRCKKIKEPKIEFKVGQIWKNGWRRPVLVCAISENKINYPVIGVFIDEDVFSSQSYTLIGRVNEDEMSTGDLEELIDEDCCEIIKKYAEER